MQSHCFARKKKNDIEAYYGGRIIGRRNIWRDGIMREEIREVIVEMFDTNASIKTGGIDLAVAKIEALYKKQYESYR